MKGKSGQPRARIPLDTNGYCWLCGFKVGATHNSRNCRYHKEGHQMEATRTNNEDCLPDA
eukprot:7931647-Ditylum_brightwellii.AAC.1